MKDLEILHKLGFADGIYDEACNVALSIYDEVDRKDYLDMESFESTKSRIGISGSDSFKHLVLILSGMLHSYDDYLEKGIPADIYYDTMSDAFVWAELHRRLEGRIGLRETGWLLYHIRLELFRLGRLQFQLDDAPCEFREVIASDKAIQIHIPDIGPLYESECIASIQKAREFYGKDLPFICDSWLLEPELSKVLDGNSNILAFQKLFHIFHVDKGNPQCHQRVFEFSSRRNTTLQTRILDAESNGSVFGVGYGYILPDEI